MTIDVGSYTARFNQAADEARTAQIAKLRSDQNQLIWQIEEAKLDHCQEFAVELLQRVESAADYAADNAQIPDTTDFRPSSNGLVHGEQLSPEQYFTTLRDLETLLTQGITALEGLPMLRGPDLVRRVIAADAGLRGFAEVEALAYKAGMIYASPEGSTGRLQEEISRLCSTTLNIFQKAEQYVLLGEQIQGLDGGVTKS